MSQARQYPGDLSPFWLESTFEIRQVLRNLAKRTEKISLRLPGDSSFITMVLDVTDRGELIFDANADSKVNAKACGDATVSVHGMLERVDIDFKLTGGRLIEYDGSPALQFPSPARLHKLQRREFFRVPTPMVKPVMCSIYLPVDASDSAKIKEHQAQVLDISIGGICVQQPVGLVLEAGQTLKACSMMIPDSGVLRFDLSIRHVFQVENRLGKVSQRAGCEFMGLSSTSQQVVQKFMAKLERDRRSVLS